MTNLVNMLVFQGVWFACVVGAAEDLWWLGPLTVLPLLGLCYWALRSRGQGRIALPFFLGLAIVGCAVEFAMTTGGVYQFARTGPLPGLVWMTALWVAFATTLPLSMRWLVTRPVLAGLSGAMFGPVCFLAGEKLGAIELLEPRWRAFAALALAWGLVLPVAGQVVVRAFASGQRQDSNEKLGQC